MMKWNWKLYLKLILKIENVDNSVYNIFIERTSSLRSVICAIFYNRPTIAVKITVNGGFFCIKFGRLMNICGLNQSWGMKLKVI